MTSTTNKFILLPPSTTTSPSKLSPPTHAPPPPTPTQLSGKWHVTHSTLPMWRTKRNVTITYTVLPTQGSLARLDDLVEYQSPASTQVKSIRGIDTLAEGERAVWDWRGKGLLKLVGSRWEVLGWGEVEEQKESDGGDAENQNQLAGQAVESQVKNAWAVTYFAKTLFTPAGIDLYSREKGGLKDTVVKGIKQALQQIDDPVVKTLAEQLFEVKIDDGRQDST